MAVATFLGNHGILLCSTMLSIQPAPYAWTTIDPALK